MQFVEYNIRTDTLLRINCSGTPINGFADESIEGTAGGTTGKSAGSASPASGSDKPAEAATPAASDAAALPDLAGTYEARVARRSPDYWCFNGRKRFTIELTQQDDKIRGIFGSGISGGIDGDISENRVYFNWYTAHCPGGTDGEWRIDKDGSSLRGSGKRDFEWTLIRNE